MATIKKLKRKYGEAYQICFTHPETKKTVRKVFRGNQVDAMKVKNQIEADISFGRFNIENKSNLKVEYSWSALEKRYKDYSKANKSPKTCKRESWVFIAFNDFLGEDIKIKDISNQTIELFRDHRLLLNKKPASVALEMRHLKVVFNMGIKWKYCIENPVISVKQPKQDIIKIRFLKESEIQDLYKCIKNDDNYDFLKLVKAYLYTGARRTELLPPLFSWDSVLFNDKKILIKGKRDLKRYISMNNELYSILIENKKLGKEFPFEFKPSYATKKIQEYYKLANIRGANLHSLRKTFGSMMLRKGIADIFKVSKLLGHSSVKTTEKYYVDFIEEDYKDAVEKLTEFY